MNALKASMSRIRNKVTVYEILSVSNQETKSFLLKFNVQINLSIKMSIFLSKCYSQSIKMVHRIWIWKCEKTQNGVKARSANEILEK